MREFLSWDLLLSVLVPPLPPPRGLPVVEFYMGTELKIETNV